MKPLSALLIAVGVLLAPVAQAASPETAQQVREILANTPDSPIEVERDGKSYSFALNPNVGLMVTISDANSTYSLLDKEADGLPNMRLEGNEGKFGGKAFTDSLIPAFDEALKALIDSKQ